MEKYIYDEKNGLWFELQGDYYLPCLNCPKENNSLSVVWRTATFAVYQAKS